MEIKVITDLLHFVRKVLREHIRSLVGRTDSRKGSEHIRSLVGRTDSRKGSEHIRSLVGRTDSRLG